MHDRPIEAEIQESLAHLRGEAGDDLRERAVSAMTAVQPARPQRRWVAIVAAAVVVAAGLGFVPIPRGRTKGVLGRAMAAAERARTVHFHRWIDGGTNREVVDQIWMAEDGFLRSESYEDGRLANVKLFAQAWWTDYRPGTEAKPGSAYVFYNPCLRHPLPMPTRDQFLREVEIMRYVADQRKLPAPEIRMQERRETSLWGGEIVVVEVEVVQQSGETRPLGLNYQPADIKAFRAEIDPRTNELFSERQYKVSNGARTLVYEATYDWNVEIPEGLRRLDLPARTVVTREDQWSSRVEQVLATDRVSDWQVTLHAVDVDRNGKLALGLSRVLSPEAKPRVFNSATPIEVEIAGDGGERYRRDAGTACYGAPNASYEVWMFRPEDPSRTPRTLTLTVYPYNQGLYEGQSVTWRDVPLPPRQEIEDVQELWKPR